MQKGDTMKKKNGPGLFVILPLILLPVLIIKDISISISEISLYIYSRSLPGIYCALTAIWLCCCPLGRKCKKNRDRILFCLVPAELMLLVIFAEYHFKTALVLFALWLFLSAACVMFVFHEKLKLKKAGKKRHRLEGSAGRISITFCAVLFLIPALFSIFVYRLENPVYAAESTQLEELTALYEARASETDDIYEANTELFLCFGDSAWQEMTSEEKITVVQALVNFEVTEVLGVPDTIEVFSEKNESSSLLGYYDEVENNIFINSDLLEESTAQNCLETICHETFHYYQHYLISSLDWDLEITGTWYFVQAAEWKYNSENYISASLSTYDLYSSQALETSAQEFAEQEAEKILSEISQ